MYNDTKTAGDRLGTYANKDGAQRKVTRTNKALYIALYILFAISLLGAMHADYNALQLGLIN